jgi:hypothetical protein
MLLTLKQFSERYPWPSISALRNWSFRSKREKRLKPLQKCFKKVGSRILIEDTEFFKAVEDLNTGKEER